MKKTLILMTMILFATILVQGMDPKKADTDSRVPELMAFHKVIYKIWHDAYPNKDYAALRGFVKEVNERFAKVEKAKLAGILRHKKEAWSKGLENLKQSVQEYSQAAAGRNDQKLLETAENLHSRFEQMVRVIMPVLKEMDLYHRVLYVVYHKYLPNDKFAEIKKAAPEMVEKAKAITTAKLYRRLQAKEKEFRTLAADLLKKSEMLVEDCAKGKGELIKKSVETVHTAYVNLEHLFE